MDALDYGNGDSIEYEYDKMGRVTKQTYEDGETVSYQYDNNGALATVTDSETGIKTTYYYDFTDRMMKYVEAGNGYTHSVGYEYDQLNNLTRIVDALNGTTRETEYTYDTDNRLTSVKTDNSSTSYTYDSLGRVSQEQTKDGEAIVLTDSYTFSPNGNNTSTQVAKHTIDAAGFDATYTYTYDGNGNILSVSDGTYTTSYVYDSQNQLLRENNQKVNKTWTWSYDSGGNIQSEREYAYTTGELGTATDTITYTYGDNDWRDLLTSYDGKAITYDDVGNMLTYGWNTYTWKHGRQLATINSWEMTYNADGLRTSRSSVNYGASFQYYYSGDTLIRQDIWDDWGGIYIEGYMEFTYDANGTPLSADYRLRHYGEDDYYDEELEDYVEVLIDDIYEGTFYYVTNLQGDVIALVDEDGNLLVKYSYDAWGKPLSPQYYNSFFTDYTDYNPLRYRGYVYDEQYGLYYLQSRYYDPEIGRFINADELINFYEILGNNLFVYCNNNPVNMIDQYGTDGQNIDIGKGWKFRIDPYNSTTKVRRHIHIWNDKKGESYSQCEDGSPHDKGSNGKGKLPRWLNKTIRNATGWDYNKNREDFFEKTTYDARENDICYTFADGTVSYAEYSFSGIVPSSVDSLESIYYSSSKPSLSKNVNSNTVYVPITAPISNPLPSFGFYWGMQPIPILP